MVHWSYPSWYNSLSLSLSGRDKDNNDSTDAEFAGCSDAEVHSDPAGPLRSSGSGDGGPAEAEHEQFHGQPVSVRPEPAVPLLPLQEGRENSQGHDQPSVHLGRLYVS